MVIVCSTQTVTQIIANVWFPASWKKNSVNFIMAHLHVDSLKNIFEIVKEIFLYDTDVFAVSET